MLSGLDAGQKSTAGREGTQTPGNLRLRQKWKKNGRSHVERDMSSMSKPTLGERHDQRPGNSRGARSRKRKREVERNDFERVTEKGSNLERHQGGESQVPGGREADSPRRGQGIPRGGSFRLGKKKHRDFHWEVDPDPPPS